MDERNIILIGGKPGSGKSTLGKNIVKAYGHPPEVAHISLGNYVRHIYDGKQDSFYTSHIRKHIDSDEPYELLDNLVTYGVVTESFIRHDRANLVLLDGYPRTTEQAEDIHTLAGDLGYNLRGMLYADIDTESAKARLLKRNRTLGQTALNETLLRRRFQIYQEHMPFTERRLQETGLHVEHISTAGSKEEALNHSLAVISLMLANGGEHKQLA